MRGFHWTKFRSEFRSIVSPLARRRKRQFADAAASASRYALVTARDLVGRQRAALDGAWDAMGFRLDEEVVLSMELQFLWGVFHEVIANGPDLPTNGYDRILLCIMLFLHEERGMSLDRARLFAMSAQTMFNQEDEVFEAIAHRGRLAFRHGSDQHYVEIVMALRKTGLR
ncbi:hypothetical protein [Bradyrhizobium sp. USDA 4486]